MREIKFRAWDKRLKKWCDTAIIGIRLDGQAISTDWLVHDLNDLILTQYTGVEGLRNTPIYDGDIVKDRMSKKIYKVVFQKLCWRLGSGGELLGNYATPEEDLEVLGNLYENPELLPQSP